MDPDDPPGCPELTLSKRERGWRIAWFGVLYLVGPLTAAAAYVTSGALTGVLPTELRSWARMINEVFGIWAPVLVGAMCAAHCLAKLCGRRSHEEVLAFVILIGIALTLSYFLLLFAGCLLVSLVSALAA